MHRAEAEEGSAERAGAGRRLARVGIGADAEIATRAEAVELGGEAPGTRAFRERARLPAARRRGDERRFAALPAGRDGKPVIAWRQARQRQRRSGAAAFAHRAAFVDEAPRRLASRRAAQGDRRRLPGRDRNKAWHEAAAQPLDPGEAVAGERLRLGR